MKSHLSPIALVLPSLLLATTLNLHADGLARREWTVDGTTREALVHVPVQAKTESTPVIFAFHGHGGTMQHSARTFAYETHWPEAIVVYMQGLNTPGRLSDPEGKRPGWQKWSGDQEDRDLKFFDAVMKSLKADYRVDSKRIYATGHSNGGAFSYLLWEQRGEVFAAFAPSGSATGQKVTLSKPKPVLHLAGENDPLVLYSWQKATMDQVRKLNQCGEGKEWEKTCTWYESKVGAPMVTFIHQGKHAFPREAPAMIVKFFKEQKQS